MKALKIVLIPVLLLALIVWAIGTYLGPDDLASCSERPSVEKGCQKADAIVAVSGGDTEARASEAIALYENGWADKIIFSGAAADKSGPSNAKVMKELAVSKGVDAKAIIIEETSQNTIENAVKTQNIFSDNDIHDAIIVTSAYHQRRAMIEFKRESQGVELRAHPVPRDKQWSAYWWATPHGWFYATSELVKSVIAAAGGTS